MTTTDTVDAKATIEQIHGLEEIGCDIVRVSAPTMEAAKALKEIRKTSASLLLSIFILTTGLHWKQ